jgi:hypothetical protein
MHSRYSSDGDFEPRVLLEMCAAAHLQVVALADHNSTRGIPEAQQRASELGIELIPGIELDCVHEGNYLHLLGYWIDAADSVFGEIEASVTAMETEASKIRIQKIEALGFVLDREALERLSFGGIITGEMIAEIVLSNPVNLKHPLMTAYRPGGKRNDNPLVNFYWDFCSPDRPAYAPVNFMSLAEAIAVIRRTGGVPILAHPGANIGINTRKLASIIQTGVDGLEAFSSYHSNETTAFFIAQAKLLNVAFTCGSDFHGKTKPTIFLGGVSCYDHEDDIMSRLRSLKPSK